MTICKDSFEQNSELSFKDQQSVQIFQYMSIQRAPLLVRYLQKLLKVTSKIIIDLEATLTCFDANKTKTLKSWGRNELLMIAKEHPYLFKDANIGIRINCLKSTELYHDIIFLRELSEIWDIDTIVGPMIESPECIDQHLNLLKKENVRFKTFIPIVETRNGLSMLKLIAKHEQIHSIQYGHQDYCLDAKIWPFFEQDEQSFWELAENFITTIESEGLNYIHPPIASIDDKDLFTFVIHKLKTICSLPCSLIAINQTQAALIKEIESQNTSALEKQLKKTSYSLQEKLDLAYATKTLCKEKERNFTVDTKSKKFISPHKYAAAMRFLEEHNA